MMITSMQNTIAEKGIVDTHNCVRSDVILYNIILFQVIFEQSPEQNEELSMKISGEGRFREKEPYVRQP